MGVMGGNMTPGTAIITWACDGTSNQFWEFDTNSGAPDTFLLRNSANPSECLSVFQKATYVGAPLVIWPCKGFDDNQDQRWSRSDFPSAPIYNFNSGLQIRPSARKARRSSSGTSGLSTSGRIRISCSCNRFELARPVRPVGWREYSLRRVIKLH